MLNITGGDIFYLHLILLNRKACSDKDVLTYSHVCGGGEPIIFTSYQQSAIAQGYVDNVDDVRETYKDMCSNGTAAQCRNYFVVLTVQSYVTHAIFDYDSRRFMFMDYITYQGVVEHVAEQMMLQDLEHKFHKSQTSMAKFGLQTPQGVPTELEEVMSHCERICLSGGSIGRIWSRFGVGGGSFSWNQSVRNGGVLGESSVYFREASRRYITGQEWDWHAPDAC